MLKFKYILDDIVAIRVPHEYLGVFSNLGGQGVLLHIAAPINALLHDAAAVLVAGDLHTLSDHCIVDELVVLGLPGAQYLLYHVVPIYILC